MVALSNTQETREGTEGELDGAGSLSSRSWVSLGTGTGCWWHSWVVVLNEQTWGPQKLCVCV